MAKRGRPANPDKSNKPGRLPENVIYDGDKPLEIKTVEDCATFTARFNALPDRSSSGYKTYWNAHGFSNPENIRQVGPTAHLRLMLCAMDAIFQNRAACVKNGGTLRVGREEVATTDFDNTLRLISEYQGKAADVVASRTASNRLLEQYATGDTDEREFAAGKLAKLGIDPEAELAARKAQAEAAAAADQAAAAAEDEDTEDAATEVETAAETAAEVKTEAFYASFDVPAETVQPVTQKHDDGYIPRSDGKKGKHRKGETANV